MESDFRGVEQRAESLPDHFKQVPATPSIAAARQFLLFEKPSQTTCDKGGQNNHEPQRNVERFQERPRQSQFAAVDTDKNR